MPTAVVYCLLLAASPGSGCGDGVTASEPCGVFAKVRRHVDYHYRLYYGHFDRHPFDYRFQYDYPWCAGPSQPHWPIAPPPQPCASGEEPAWEARRPTSAAQTAAGSSLKLIPVRTSTTGK